VVVVVVVVVVVSLDQSRSARGSFCKVGLPSRAERFLLSTRYPRPNHIKYEAKYDRQRSSLREILNNNKEMAAADVERAWHRQRNCREHHLQPSLLWLRKPLWQYSTVTSYLPRLIFDKLL
jgi:hypothetical protein